MSFEVFAVVFVVGYCSTIRLVPLWGRKQWTLQRKSIVVGKFLITKSVTGHEKNKEKSVVGHIDENYQFMTNNTADWKRPTTVAAYRVESEPPEWIIVWNCRWWLLLKMRAKNEHKKIKKFDLNYHSSYQNLNTFAGLNASKIRRFHRKQKFRNVFLRNDPCKLCMECHTKFC